jgi:hypothetical protein
MRGTSIVRAVFALDPAVTMTDSAAQRETIRQVEVGQQAAVDTLESTIAD